MKIEDSEDIEDENPAWYSVVHGTVESERR